MPWFMLPGNLKHLRNLAGKAVQMAIGFGAVAATLGRHVPTVVDFDAHAPPSSARGQRPGIVQRPATATNMTQRGTGANGALCQGRLCFGRLRLPQVDYK